MLIDTHCHLNILAKDSFDTPLRKSDLIQAQKIVNEAMQAQVTTLINVGTSLIESANCVLLAQKFDRNYAVVGIHPNDLTSSWAEDFKTIEKWLAYKEEKNIVGIGETGMDFHYPNYDKNRQRDAFKAQIELALEYELALVVHSRDAHHETLAILDEYKKDISRAVIHCFSYDYDFAKIVTDWGFLIGIDGPITYPKNTQLREIVATIPLEHIVLETDAPFLPPQIIRGKKNHPQYLAVIAQYIAQLRNVTYTEIADITTKNAQRLFALPKEI